MTFECEMSKPGKKVEWLKDGKKIKPDKRTKITVDGTKHQLTLTAVKVEDIAEYTAKAPDDTTSAKLTVEGITASVGPQNFYLGVFQV